MNILGITCGQLAPFMRILAYLIKLLKIAIPIVLIALIVIDFFKATVASDEKKMNEAKNVAIKRIVYALVIFLVPTLVSLMFKNLGNTLDNSELTNATEWIGCFNRYN